MVVLEPVLEPVLAIVLVLVPPVLPPVPVVVVVVVEVAAGDAVQRMCIPERRLQLCCDGRKHPSPDYF